MPASRPRVASVPGSLTLSQAALRVRCCGRSAWIDRLLARAMGAPSAHHGSS